MNRVRPALVAWPAWWPLLVAVALMAPLTVYWWGLVAQGSVAFDWRQFVVAGERFWARSPDLYAVTDLYSYRHSPVLAAMMPVIGLIGVTGIRIVTFACALALPTWPMRLLAIGSWPLAMDLQHGAFISVIVLAAAWALKGSRVGGIAFIVLALFSPRPLMVPIVVYLLWQQPWLRVPSAALFVVHGVAVLATGYADGWIGTILAATPDGLDSPFNLSPSRFIGTAWAPIGTVLAAFLTWRGHPGIAALAINPYVLPHYLLFVLLELGPRAGKRKPAGHLSPTTASA